MAVVVDDGGPDAVGPLQQPAESVGALDVDDQTAEIPQRVEHGQVGDVGQRDVLRAADESAVAGSHPIVHRGQNFAQIVLVIAQNALSAEQKRRL